MQLQPGMFANVRVVGDEMNEVVTVPRTAIPYNTYGDFVFEVVNGEGGQKIVERVSVMTGDVRNGELEIVEGIEATVIRLRPILMTSVALIVAMVPLLTASGPGAESRFAIGLIIATGLGIGTLLTVFVLPAFYCLLARDHAARRREGESTEAPA